MDQHISNDKIPPDRPQEGPMCTVNMAFNYSVGIIASLIGLTLLYLAWRWLAG